MMAAKRKQNEMEPDPKPETEQEQPFDEFLCKCGRKLGFGAEDLKEMSKIKGQMNQILRRNNDSQTQWVKTIREILHIMSKEGLHQLGELAETDENSSGDDEIETEFVVDDGAVAVRQNRSKSIKLEIEENRRETALQRQKVMGMLHQMESKVLADWKATENTGTETASVSTAAGFDYGETSSQKDGKNHI